MRVGGGPPTSLDWLYEVRNGRAYTVFGEQAAVAAQNSHVQLLNPSGSGKTVYLYLAQARPVTTQAITVRRYDTALTTLVGAGANCKGGGAASQALCRTQGNAGALGIFIATQYITALTTTQWGPLWVLSLAETQGMVFINPNVNEILSCNFWWVER